MPSRRRSVPAVDDEAGRDAVPALLRRIRNMWQFANVCQWIYIFGRAAKIDESIDVEEIEAECLKPNSVLLADLALAVLKLVSSHRGLTHDIFEDQVRKQYLAKAPDKNPFGGNDEPCKFADLDVFAKIKVLQQLTQWSMIHPERIRDKMEEQKDSEQTSWRIEPYGWDREDRTYYVLDDNRVYRLTNPPPVQVRPKPMKSKLLRSGRRASKRQRTGPSASGPAADMCSETAADLEPVDDGLGGRVWECIAVTLQEVREFLETLGKTRDENEKVLRRQLETHLVPILEKQEEIQKRKQLQRERELLNIAKMANAKRSSRIAGKVEKQKQEEKAKEEEQQQMLAEAARRHEGQERLKLEKERDFRMFSRQRRLQEREARRLQHEEELAQLSEDSRNASSTTGRISGRRLRAEIERNRQALEDLEQEEEEWVFDCLCGLYGQVDDGTHSVACERCNVWQHSKCLGVSKEEADRPEFHFVCGPCKRRDDASKAPPKSTIKLKLNPTSSSSGIIHSQPAEQPRMSPIANPPVASDNTSKRQIEKALSAAPVPPSKDRLSHPASNGGQHILATSTATSTATSFSKANEPVGQSAPIPSLHKRTTAEANKTTDNIGGQDASSIVVRVHTVAAVSQPMEGFPSVGSPDVGTTTAGSGSPSVSSVAATGAHVDGVWQGSNKGVSVDTASNPARGGHDALKASNSLSGGLSNVANLPRTSPSPSL